MSVQLHRRLAYRTGSGSTDIDTQSASFWDSTDYSSIRLESRMYLAGRSRLLSSGSATSPYKYNYNVIGSSSSGYNVQYYVPHAIFLGNGSTPLVTFSGLKYYDNSGLYNAYEGVRMDALFAAYDYCGGGSSLTTSKIARYVSRFPRNPRYFGKDTKKVNVNNGDAWGENILPSGLIPATMSCTSDRMHWYVFQRGNYTGTFYTGGGYVECGVSGDSLTGSLASKVKSRCTAHTISTDYGMRILHIKSTGGGIYPLQASVERMMSSFAAPGTFTKLTTNAEYSEDYGFLLPSINREKWDFTLDALCNGDVSPAGYFTDDMPVHMQVCDGGTKMFFLSVVSTNGRRLSMRTFEKNGEMTPYDITNLSAVSTDCSLDLFRGAVCDALGVASTYFTWHWFKFNPLGNVLILLSPDGVLAKFKLTSAFDLNTLSLVTAVRLPMLVAGEYLPSDGNSDKFLPLYYTKWSAYLGGGNSSANYSNIITYPVMAADVDPEGNSLIVSIGPSCYYTSDNVTYTSPARHANMIVQYRL